MTESAVCRYSLLPQITYLDEYYLTNYEIEVLKKSCDDIAGRIPEGSMLIELGSGFVDSHCPIKPSSPPNDF
jgi:uncharacterized SAM-dependent methyltransferase